jgi:hypothetical protein
MPRLLTSRKVPNNSMSQLTPVDLTRTPSLGPLTPGAMNIKFRLKSKIRPDPLGNGLLFTDPAIRADFTEVLEESIRKVADCN